MQIEPTKQELLMLGMLREWSGKDNCRMVVEFRQGAWDIAMSYAWTNS